MSLQRVPGVLPAVSLLKQVLLPCVPFTQVCFPEDLWLAPCARPQPWDAARGPAEPVRAGEGQSAGAGAVPAAGEVARGASQSGQRYRGEEGRGGAGWERTGQEAPAKGAEAEPFMLLTPASQPRMMVMERHL